MRRFISVGAPVALLLTAVVAQAQPLPTNLTITPADASVVINHDPLDASEVEFVRLFRSTEPGVRGEQVARLREWRANSPLHGVFADGALDNGTTYYYSIQTEAPDGTLSTTLTDQIAVTPQRNTSVPVPRLASDWIQLTPNSPSDYEWDNGTADNAVDFSIWQADDGTWQLVSCIRGTTYPGGGRLLYRWESDNLTDSNWTPKGVFATSQTEAPFNEVEGRVQAPQVFKEEDTYYMIYNSNGAHMMTSEDGKNFERITNDAGSHQLFEMNRDVNILDNRDVDGLYYAYYTDNQPGFGMRTSETLLGEWSEATHLHHNGFFESPFVQEYEGLYYLFAPTTVFVTDDPTDFDKPMLTQMIEGTNFQRIAAEIIQDGDQWYIATYNRDGIALAELEWQAIPEPASALSLGLLGGGLLMRPRR